MRKGRECGPGRRNRVSRLRIVKAPIAFSCGQHSGVFFRVWQWVAECHPEFPLVWKGLLESVQRPI